MSPGTRETKSFGYGGFASHAELLLEIERVQHLMRIVQIRLGSKFERSDDVDQAQELVHKLNNLQCALQLWAENDGALGG
jgi:hypothetical protein